MVSAKEKEDQDKKTLHDRSQKIQGLGMNFNYIPNNFEFKKVIDGKTRLHIVPKVSIEASLSDEKFELILADATIEIQKINNDYNDWQKKENERIEQERQDGLSDKAKLKEFNDLVQEKAKATVLTGKGKNENFQKKVSEFLLSL